MRNPLLKKSKVKNKLSVLFCVTLLFVNCSNDESDAKKSITEHIHNKLEKEHKYTRGDFSKLYNVWPIDESKLPSVEDDVFFAEYNQGFEKRYEEFIDNLDEGAIFQNKINNEIECRKLYFSTEIKLPWVFLFGGNITTDNIRRIIHNDLMFEKYNTGGKEYLMLHFFTLTDDKGKKEQAGAVFVLDSALNIEYTQKIKDIDKILQMIK